MTLTPSLCATGTLSIYEGLTTAGKLLATLTSKNVDVPEIWGNGGIRLEFFMKNIYFHFVISLFNTIL